MCRQLGLSNSPLSDRVPVVPPRVPNVPKLDFRGLALARLSTSVLRALMSMWLKKPLVAGA